MASSAGASSEIEENQQKRLEENEKEIINLMDIDSILTSLQSLCILTNKDIDEIKLPHHKKDKVQSFIGRLSMRGSEAFPKLIEVLRESKTKDHTQLADLLDNCPTAIVSVNQRMDEIRYERSVDRTLKEHDTRLKNLEDDTRARDEVEKFKKMLESKQAELEEVKAKLQQQENDANALKEENDKLKKRIDDLEAEVNDLRAGKAKAEEEVKALTERMAAMEQKHDMFQQDIQQQLNDLKMKDRNPDKDMSTTKIEPANRFQKKMPTQPRGGASKPAGGRGRGTGATTWRR